MTGQGTNDELQPTVETLGPMGFTPREWRIVLPLSFAAFFENYDYALLSVAAPVVSSGLGVSPSRFGIAVAFIRLFGLAAIVLVGLADRVGRRRMLLLTLWGFVVFTGLTASAWGLVSFVVLGSSARLFLSAEATMSSLVIAEEVAPVRRGRAISIAGLIGQTGFGAVAILIPLVDSFSFGWRLLYLFALGPLFVVGLLRRNLGETTAFDVAAEEQRVQQHRIIPRLERRWRRRTLTCSLIFASVGAFQSAAVYHAAQLAQTTYDWAGTYTAIVMVSGIFTLLGFIVGGRGSDRVGRRPAITLGIAVEVIGMVLLFEGGESWYAVGWFAFVFGQAAIAGCWLAFVAELVPTEVRATVTSIVVSVQVAGGSAGLAVTSWLGSTPAESGTVSNWLGALSVASLLALWRLPEAAGRDMVARYDS